MFSIRRAGQLVTSQCWNISVLNHEGDPMDITQARVCTRVCTRANFAQINAGECLNLRQFTINRKWKVKTEWSNDGAFRHLTPHILSEDKRESTSTY